MSHDNNHDAPASPAPSPSITTTTTTVINSPVPTDRPQADAASGAASAPGPTGAPSNEPPARLHGCVETAPGGALVCGWVKKLSGVPVGSPPEDDDGTPGKDPKRRR